MIEFLNRRRMITLIIMLVAIVVVVVIIEDLIADHETSYVEHYRRQSNQTKPSNKNAMSKPSDAPVEHKIPLMPPSVPVGHCWEKESFKVVDGCRLCFRAEAQLPACLSSGYREHILCEQSGDAFRNCDSPTKSFWFFEIFMFVLAWLFNVQVRRKQDELRKIAQDRISLKLDCNV